jgi:hypothetical protein
MVQQIVHTCSNLFKLFDLGRRVPPPSAGAAAGAQAAALPVSASDEPHAATHHNAHRGLRPPAAASRRPSLGPGGEFEGMGKTRGLPASKAAVQVSMSLRRALSARE